VEAATETTSVETTTTKSSGQHFVARGNQSACEQRNHRDRRSFHRFLL
jgi:hypothetical protein